MNLKILILLLIQVFIFTKNEAQDSILNKPIHVFGLYSGLSYNILRDDAMFEDVNFNGFSVPVLFNYRYIGNKIRQDCSVYFTQTNLNASNTYLTTQLTVLNTYAYIDYSYNRKVFSNAKNSINFYTGLKIQSLINFRLYNDYQYYQNEVMCEQFTTLGLNLKVEKAYHNRDNLLCLNICFPFLAYSLVNNVYNQWVNSISQELPITNKTKITINDLWQLIREGELISFNRLFQFDTELSYTRFFNKHIGLELKYSLMYYSFAQYSDILYSKNIDSRLLMGLVFRK